MPSIVLVVMQLGAIAALVVPWGGAAWSAWGWPPLLASAALAAWTLRHNRPGNFGVMPEVRPQARLITTGPYALVRHPMYLAVLLFGLAMVAGWQHAGHVAAFALLLVVLHAKADREERLLAARFPDYAAYRAGTKRLIPFLL